MVRTGRYMLDDWGLAFKQASQSLLAILAERQETAPGGHRWKIAVCGPHRSPQVELGPAFETTWEPQGADFAMVLGVFYCANPTAPVLTESSVTELSMPASTTSAAALSTPC